MRYETIGRGLRALRHRRGLRQADVSAMSGVARSVISEFEAGRIDAHTLESLNRAAAAVGASVRVELVVPGGTIYRLLDADHAGLQAAWKQLLERPGWLVDAEVTFNHYGERGSIDLLAWHPPTRTLLVVEIKTTIVDVQDLLSGVDRKARVARALASQQSRQPALVVPMILVAEGSTARRRLVDHAALFSRFHLRGRAAIAWLKSPAAPAAPRGLLLLSKLPPARSDDRRRAGRQRIRRQRCGSRS